MTVTVDPEAPRVVIDGGPTIQVGGAVEFNVTGDGGDGAAALVAVEEARALAAEAALQATLDLKASSADLIAAQASITAALAAHAAGDASDAELAAAIAAAAVASSAAVAAAQAYAVQRANHTGTQTLSTISDAGTAAGKDAGAAGLAGKVLNADDPTTTNSRPPNGAAGGVLNGTYPNPGFAADMATQAELDAVSAAKQSTSEKNQASGYAGLGSDGKLAAGQIPALGLVTVQTAASQAAQLALTTQEGDVVVRTDQNKSYVRNSGTAGTMADFTELLTPTDQVLSVAGLTGAVSGSSLKTALALASGDISGLGTAATKDSGAAGAAGKVLAADDASTSNSRAPNGAAGGVLGGTYPNPTFAADMATQVELDAVSATLTALGFITPAVKTADETVNNSATLQDDDHLTIPIPSAGRYRIELLLLTSATSATPDWKFDLVYSGSGNTYFAPVISAGGSTWGGATAAQAPNALTTGGVTGVISGGANVTPGGLLMLGVLIATTGGNLKLQWAQGTADATNSKLLIGSSMSGRKLP